MTRCIRCTLCEQTNIKIWGEKNSYEIYVCLSCTHKFVDLGGVGRPENDPELFRKEITNDLMASDLQYYEHLARGEAPGRSTTINAGHIFDLLNKHNVKFSGDWMDIGCGSGYLLSQAKNAGFETTGIEPGGWGQIAAERKHLNVVQGFLTNKTFLKHFDIISATDVVEHIPTPVDFMKLMSSYLLPGGFIIISIPFSDSLEARLFQTKWDMVAPPTHCQFFSLSSLKLLLELSGLELIDYKQFNIGRISKIINNSYLRKFIDTVIPGPQLICLIKKYG